MKTKMFVVTHKKFECPNIKNYIPIQVGAKDKEKLGYLEDSSYNNISERNLNYCELTGIYWIWKNVKDIDYVGISHYRRYFSKSEIRKNKKNFLNTQQIEKILKIYDIILPKKEIYKEKVIEQYCRNSGFKEDLYKVEKILKEKYSNYLECFNEVMNSNSIHQYNMMVCSKSIYDKYCKWLFDILFELEKDIDLSKYNDYQKRIYGFLSERLLNVWVKANKLSIKEMNVVNMECKIKNIIRIKLRRIKNNITFKRNKKKGR